MCVYLIVCVLETSTVRRSRPELGCGATKSGIRDAALQVSVCQVVVGAKECAAAAVRIVCVVYIYMKRTSVCLPDSHNASGNGAWKFGGSFKMFFFWGGSGGVGSSVPISKCSWCQYFVRSYRFMEQSVGIRASVGITAPYCASNMPG